MVLPVGTDVILRKLLFSKESRVNYTHFFKVFNVIRFYFPLMGHDVIFT